MQVFFTEQLDDSKSQIGQRISSVHVIRMHSQQKKKTPNFIYTCLETHRFLPVLSDLAAYLLAVQLVHSVHRKVGPIPSSLAWCVSS
jgi:hypothetical protein